MHIVGSPDPDPNLSGGGQLPDPDPNPSGGGQLPNPNEWNSTLTSAARGETLIPSPNKYNSTLTSGNSGGAYIYIVVVY